MANYYCSCRSNYFKVKDVEAFKKHMDCFSVNVHEKEGQFCILGNDADGGGWPTYSYDEATENNDEVDFFKEVAEHLTDDSIAVFIEAGAEKLRYIVGYAVAVNSKGEEEFVSLNDIYEAAEKRFGIKPTEATY